MGGAGDKDSGVRQEEIDLTVMYTNTDDSEDDWACTWHVSGVGYCCYDRSGGYRRDARLLRVHVPGTSEPDDDGNVYQDKHDKGRAGLCPTHRGLKYSGLDLIEEIDNEVSAAMSGWGLLP